MTDSLGELLHRADTAAPAGTPPHALALRVRKRHARRIQITATLLAMGIMTSALLLASNRKHDPAPIVVVPPAQVTHDPLVTQVHEQTAERMLAAQRSRTSAVPTIQPDPLASVRKSREHAALVLIYEADALARTNRPRDAIASYRRAIDLFPQTYWATVARKRIKEMS